MKEWAIIVGILAVIVFIYLLLFDHSGKKPKAVNKFENSKTGEYIKVIIIVVVGLFIIVATLKEALN